MLRHVQRQCFVSTCFQKLPCYHKICYMFHVFSKYWTPLGLKSNSNPPIFYDVQGKTHEKSQTLVSDHHPIPPPPAGGVGWICFASHDASKTGAGGSRVNWQVENPKNWCFGSNVTFHVLRSGLESPQGHDVFVLEWVFLGGYQSNTRFGSQHLCSYIPSGREAFRR